MINFNRDMSRGRDRRDDRREDRQMYKATCDDCGRSCEVPFKPSGDKPIFCSNCFKRDNASEDRGGRGRDRGSRDRDGGRDRDRGGRDRDRGSRDTVTMHKAICADCGRNCEVPFKPTQDKPVYCSDCFSKNNGGRPRSSRPEQSSRPDQSSKKHDELN
ncbi:hypothetical protein KKD70_00675, partial [Patescibacteria group bacterium]|nr:hypothetical protein [Patescibacteria group bacterium]